MTAGIAPARSGYTTISMLSRVYGFGTHLRQDHPRLAPGLHRRRRPARRDGARHGRRRVEHLPHPTGSDRDRRARRQPASLDDQPLWQRERDGPQARHARRLHDLQVRRDLRHRHRPVVDLRAVGHARRRGEPRQPRHRGGGAVRQATDRAREGRRPRDDARARHGGPRLRHHVQLDRVRRRLPGRHDPTAVLGGLRPVDRVHRPVLRRPRVRPVAAPRSGRVGRDRRSVDGCPVVHERPRRRRPARRREPVPLDGEPHRPGRHVRLAARRPGRGDRRDPAGDRGRAVHAARPRRHRRPVPAHAARGRPRCPRGDHPGVRRTAAPRAVLGDQPGPGRRAVRLAHGVAGGHARGVQPRERVRRPVPRVRPDDDRWLAPAVRRAPVHRDGLCRGDARLEVGDRTRPTGAWSRC